MIESVNAGKIKTKFDSLLCNGILILKCPHDYTFSLFVGSCILLYTPKKMSSQFFTDEHGQYITFGCLNNMKNAEYVNVFFIQTDLEALFIGKKV